jgi:hypothetical protein
VGDGLIADIVLAHRGVSLITTRAAWLAPTPPGNSRAVWGKIRDATRDTGSGSIALTRMQ